LVGDYGRSAAQTSKSQPVTAGGWLIPPTLGIVDSCPLGPIKVDAKSPLRILSAQNSHKGNRPSYFPHLLSLLAASKDCKLIGRRAHCFFPPPNNCLTAEPTPSTTPPAPSKPFRPSVPSPSATSLILTPSCPAIAVAMRVDKLSLSEKFGWLVSPLRVNSTARRRELEILENNLALAVQIVVAHFGVEIQVESPLANPGLVFLDEIG
jgi:hypothetical protein